LVPPAAENLDWLLELDGQVILATGGSGVSRRRRRARRTDPGWASMVWRQEERTSSNSLPNPVCCTSCHRYVTAISASGRTRRRRLIPVPGCFASPPTRRIQCPGSSGTLPGVVSAPPVGRRSDQALPGTRQCCPKWLRPNEASRQQAAPVHL